MKLNQFQCFDKTYKYNLSSERNHLKRYNQLQIRIKKRSNNLKGTDVNQWEEDDKEISNWNWKDSLPKNPNIHFLYFDF